MWSEKINTCIAICLILINYKIFSSSSLTTSQTRHNFATECSSPQIRQTSRWINFKHTEAQWAEHGKIVQWKMYVPVNVVLRFPQILKLMFFWNFSLRKFIWSSSVWKKVKNHWSWGFIKMHLFHILAYCGKAPEMRLHPPSYTRSYLIWKEIP